MTFCDFFFLKAITRNNFHVLSTQNYLRFELLRFPKLKNILLQFQIESNQNATSPFICALGNSFTNLRQNVFYLVSKTFKFKIQRSFNKTQLLLDYLKKTILAEI